MRRTTAGALLLAFVCQPDSAPVAGQDIPGESRLSLGTLPPGSGSHDSYGYRDSESMTFSGWSDLGDARPSGELDAAGDTGSVTPPEAAGESADREKWTFDFASYVWMAGLTGDGTIRGNRASGTLSFSDILENMDLGAMGHVEARKGDWGLLADVLFIELSDDLSVNSLIDVDIRVQLALVEVAGFYRFAEWRLDELIEGSSIQFEGLAGNRLVYVDGKVNFDPGPVADDDKTWLDPIIGVRARWSFTKKLWLAARGDIGGFGIGSHFVWNVQGLLGYQLTPGIYVAAGYRALDINYSDGHGNQKFALDARLDGPVLGMGFEF